MGMGMKSRIRGTYCCVGWGENVSWLELKMLILRLENKLINIIVVVLVIVIIISKYKLSFNHPSHHPLSLSYMHCGG